MNKIFLIGNLTRDPELRTTPNGVNVCSFSIGVSRKFTNQSGERVTDFFNIVAWRALGENCAKYLAKGRKVSVVGELQTRTYDAKDGTKKTAFEIIADDVEFLTPRDKDASGASSYQRNASPAPYSGGSVPSGEGFTDVNEDELPF